jgi:hypothetical protein
MDVVGGGLDNGDCFFIFTFDVLQPHLIFRVKESVVAVRLKLMKIDCGYPQSSMEAFGNAAHLGVAVPIELFIGRHNHKEKSVVFGFMNGKGDYCMRYFQISEDGVDDWYA